MNRRCSMRHSEERCWLWCLAVQLDEQLIKGTFLNQWAFFYLVSKTHIKSKGLVSFIRYFPMTHFISHETILLSVCLLMYDSSIFSQKPMEPDGTFVLLMYLLNLVRQLSRTVTCNVTVTTYKLVYKEQQVVPVVVRFDITGYSVIFKDT